MTSLLEVLQKSAAFLERKGVEHPRLNAELLAGHALGLPRMQLYLQFERLLPESELELIRPLILRRSQREPLQHIIGSVEFAGVTLKVDRRALIPRPETEYLVELVGAAFASNPPATVLDLGTGSGALALALAAKWPGAEVWATDISEEALTLAKENCAALALEGRVKVLQSDWFTALPRGQGFDLIVANPPYLTAEEVAATQPEVQDHEPAIALSTAADGMDAFKCLVAEGRDWLKPAGLMALETGIAQHPALVAGLAEAGFVAIESRADLTGRDRFLFARNSV